LSATVLFEVPYPKTFMNAERVGTFNTNRTAFMNVFALCVKVVQYTCLCFWSNPFQVSISIMSNSSETKATPAAPEKKDANEILAKEVAPDNYFKNVQPVHEYDSKGALVKSAGFGIRKVVSATLKPGNSSTSSSSSAAAAASFDVIAKLGIRESEKTKQNKEIKKQLKDFVEEEKKGGAAATGGQAKKKEENWIFFLLKTPTIDSLEILTPFVCVNFPNLQFGNWQLAPDNPKMPKTMRKNIRKAEVSVQLTSSAWDAEFMVTDAQGNDHDSRVLEFFEWFRRFEHQALFYEVTETKSLKVAEITKSREAQARKNALELAKEMEKNLASEESSLTKKQIAERKAKIDKAREPRKVTTEEVVEALRDSGFVTDRIKSNEYNGKTTAFMEISKHAFRRKRMYDDESTVPIAADGHPHPVALAAFHNKKEPMVYDPPEITQLAFKDENGNVQPARPLEFKDRVGLNRSVMAFVIRIHPLVDSGPKSDYCGVRVELVRGYYLRPWQPMAPAYKQGAFTKSSNTSQGV
jgi:hypothetical protein